MYDQPLFERTYGNMPGRGPGPIAEAVTQMKQGAARPMTPQQGTGIPWWMWAAGGLTVLTGAGALVWWLRR